MKTVEERIAVIAGASSAIGHIPATESEGGQSRGIILRALALFALEGMAVAAATWTLTRGNELLRLALDNAVTATELRWPLYWVVAGGVVPVALTLVLGGASRAPAPRTYRAALTLSPLLVAPLIALSFHWELWRNAELNFLVLIAAATFSLEKTARVALAANAGLTPPRYFVQLTRWWERSPEARHLPLLIATAAAAGYAVYFSYYTVAYHLNGHTSTFDLAIEENIVWQTLHGGPLFASTPIYGASLETHFSRHATFIAFLIAPIYALSERAETLLILQSVWLGFGAIPLYLLTQRRAGPDRRSVAYFHLLALCSAARCKPVRFPLPFPRAASVFLFTACDRATFNNGDVAAGGVDHFGAGGCGIGRGGRRSVLRVGGRAGARRRNPGRGRTCLFRGDEGLADASGRRASELSLFLRRRASSRRAKLHGNPADADPESDPLSTGSAASG